MKSNNHKPKTIVDKVYESPKYLVGVKKLKNDHRIKELNTLKEVVDKLIHFEITSEYKNHPVGNGVFDIHIAGDVILLYRYKDDMLILTLELHDITNHKQLNKDLSKIK